MRGVGCELLQEALFEVAQQGVVLCFFVWRRHGGGCCGAVPVGMGVEGDGLVWIARG